MPRNRAGIGDDVNTELSSEGESTFLQAEAPQREGGVSFSRKLIKEVRG